MWRHAVAATVGAGTALRVACEAPKRAAEDEWWHHRRSRGPPRPRPSAAERDEEPPRLTRVVCLGDSITYGFDPAAKETPPRLPMTAALAAVARTVGASVPPGSVERFCSDTVAAVDSLWRSTSMDRFLRGGDHPAGPHHGLQLGDELGPAPAGGRPTKQQLAALAERFGVDTGWGWPWPSDERAPPQLARPWPAQLQRLLGEGFEVLNLGVSGVTLLEQGHNPISMRRELQQALEVAPDVVVINLVARQLRAAPAWR